MNFLLLHGTCDTPESSWLPWLARELEKQGHTVLRPQLPTPEGQTPDTWIKVISDSVQKLGGGEEVVIVAHSMSPMAVCHYLATRTSPVKACFFVSGFAQFPSDFAAPYGEVNPPFCTRPIDWSAVRKNCNKFVCFAGDNDPYVPLAVAKDFAAKCGTKLIVIPNGGHLTANAGFTSFPQLLQTIVSYIHT
jgi:uncharacterized protein